MHTGSGNLPRLIKVVLLKKKCHYIQVTKLSIFHQISNLDLKEDLFKMSNASFIVDEIEDHSRRKLTKRLYLNEFVFDVMFACS